MEFDRDKPRPLEVRVRDFTDGEGVSFARSEALQRSACDALLTVHILREEDEEVLLAASIDGATKQPMDPKLMFRAWVSLTGHMARTFRKSDDREVARRGNFCLMVLAHMKLDETLMRLDDGAEAPPEDPAEPTSSQLPPSDGTTG